MNIDEHERIDAVNRYIKTHPRDWKTGALTDTYIEQWVSLKGQAVKVHYKLTHWGSETHTFHDQEFPCAYINTQLYRLITYTNSNPWTNDGINELSIPQTDPGTPNTEFYPTEYWASFVNNQDFGLTMYSPDYTPKWAAHRFTINTRPGYLATVDQFDIGPGAVIEGTEYFIAGDYSEARSIIYSLLLDTTPPASITDLCNTTGQTWINWTWDNPLDVDFNHTVIYFNGEWKENTSDPFYNATDLSPNLNYEIGTHTVDINGNINSTWINQTTKTTSQKGDLNGDGEITSEDVGMALDVVFSGEYVIEADVDENGYVNILDVRMIMQAAAGNIEL